MTGLRIVAAMWVVCFHFMGTPGEAYRQVWEPLRPILNTGALGVDLFFVLSGFVITLSYLDKMGSRPRGRVVVSFWWARVCRVWPVYLVITTLFGGWLLFKATRVTDGYVAYQAVQPVVDVRHYLEQLLMVQLWHEPTFEGVSWVGPGWSISAEWSAYVCFPLAVLVLWRLRRLPAVVTGTLAVLVLVPIAYTCYRTGGPYFPWSWALRIGGGFLAGALTCLAVRRIPHSPRVERLATGIAALVVVEILIGLWWGFQRGGGGGNYGGVVVLGFPVLVGALALSRSGISRVLSTGPMVHGGRISFSLYLVHMPLFEVLWTSMGWEPRLAPGSPLGAAVVPHVLLLSLVVAHLCYRYLEEPARLWLRHRGPGRWATPVRPVVEQRPAARGAGPATVVAPGSFPTPRPARPSVDPDVVVPEGWLAPRPAAATRGR